MLSVGPHWTPVDKVRDTGRMRCSVSEDEEKGARETPTKNGCSYCSAKMARGRVFALGARAITASAFRDDAFEAPEGEELDTIVEALGVAEPVLGLKLP